ncbi:RbsD/FucU family protein [Agriterribacter sp.]|uniref:RbsD/FucU family protein n=1 Tax=Agriterribacter sp. TaxID=2821509 RepID=UPI002B88DF01|nr:RbsD/FucU family protein [Agriterribacter sp.]HTN06822.1 RbsD/FucU family protein [Agriterribacter sp.]
MLKSTILHPELLYGLSLCGHGSKILIADANFPVTTKTPATAKKIFLNIAPGLVDATTILKLLMEIIPIESAAIMTTPDLVEQPIHTVYKSLLTPAIPVTGFKRMEFYQYAESKDTYLAIATGETRRFANLLLTVGVIKPGISTAP